MAQASFGQSSFTARSNTSKEFKFNAKEAPSAKNISYILKNNTKRNIIGINGRDTPTM